MLMNQYLAGQGIQRKLNFKGGVEMVCETTDNLGMFSHERLFNNTKVFVNLTINKSL